MNRSTVFLAFAVVSSGSASTLAQSWGPALVVGKPLQADLNGAAAQSYVLNLTRGQVARVIVDQDGVDVVLSIFSPEGRRIQEVDGLTGSVGEEEAIVPAETAGSFRMEVHAPRPGATGRYTIRLDRFLTDAEYQAERFAGLGRVWGMVRYFHPFLAYKDVDWDGAVVKAAPRVKAAWTTLEYRKAIDSMLGALDDPLTTTIAVAPERAPGAQAPAATAEPRYVSLVDGYMVVDATQVAIASVTGKAAAAAEQTKRTADLAGIKGVLIDCRYGERSPGEVPEFYLTRYLRALLPALIQGSMALGTERYRLHAGYEQQKGVESGYHSSFATRVPDSIVGQAKEKVSLVLLVDERTPNLLPLLSGLQAYGGRVVQVGAANRAPGGEVRRMLLPLGVRVNVRLTDFLHPDGSTTFSADLVLETSALAQGLGPALAAFSLPSRAPVSRPGDRAATRGEKDNPYPEMSFPSEEYRLLALFRLWNTIHYFFPYRALTDLPWETTLEEFVPRFLASASALDYQTAVAEMVARTQDSHGFVIGMDALEQHLGRFAPPIRLASAGGRAVVTEITASEGERPLDIRLGDEVLSIDGEPVHERLLARARLTALSTPQAMYSSVLPSVLSGHRDSVAALSVRGVDGAVRGVSVTRTAPLASVQSARRRTTPIYGRLPSGYGYVDLARLPLASAQKAMDEVMKTPAVIFDMRGYPNGTAWEIAPRLTDKDRMVAASFRTPLRSGLDFEDAGDSGMVFQQKLPARKGAVYRGKVAMLINENAISQSEHTCLFFEAAVDVTFIGGPTNGADGGVTNMVLPGGLWVGFTGVEVRHADGRQLQRVGVQPHVRVEPTPQGIAASVDEVLEAAIKHLDARPLRDDE